MSFAALLGQLGVVCPSCDRLNPPKSSTCQSCGARTAPQPLSRPPVKPAPSAVSAPGTSPVALAPKVTSFTPQATSALPPRLNPLAIPPASKTPAAPTSIPSPTSRTPLPAAAPRFALVDLNGPKQGQRRKLTGDALALGRSRGAILLPLDASVSAHHATFSIREGRLYVRDEHTPSGIYVLLRGEEPLALQAQFSAGERCFRYAGTLKANLTATGRPTPYGSPFPSTEPLFAVEEVLIGGRTGRVAVATGTLSIGQAGCHLSFPKDPSVALRHCEVVLSSSGACLRDLSNGLGTFMRIAAGVEVPLKPKERLRIGHQLFEVEG